MSDINLFEIENEVREFLINSADNACGIQNLLAILIEISRVVKKL